jgi:hypothetical protein
VGSDSQGYGYGEYIFQNMTPYGFGRRLHVFLRHSSFFFWVKSGSVFLLNVGKFIPGCKVSDSRIWRSLTKILVNIDELYRLLYVKFKLRFIKFLSQS